MKRLRIGINGRALSNPAVRGWTRYTANLLRALSERDDVDLVLFCREAPESCHLDGVDAEILCFDAARESMWEEWYLPAAIRRARIDVFHAPADRGLPLRKPCPFVVTLHNSYERTHWARLFPAARSRAWYWKNELANAWCSDAIVTVSQTTRAELLALKVCAPEHLHVVALAPAAEFGPTALAGWARRRSWQRGSPRWRSLSCT